MSLHKQCVKLCATSILVTFAGHITSGIWWYLPATNMVFIVVVVVVVVVVAFGII